MDLLVLFGFYIVTAFMLASIGVFYSTLFRKSLVSLIITYITVLAILFGTPIIYGIWNVLHMSANAPTLGYNHMLAVMFSNPLFGFGSIMEGINGSSSIFSDILRVFYGSRSINTGQHAISPWLANIIFDVLAFVLLALLSARKIQPVKKRLIFKRKG